jgi:hypothetical protein
LDFRYAKLIALAMDRLEAEALGTTGGAHPRVFNAQPAAELSIFVGREEEELVAFSEPAAC